MEVADHHFWNQLLARSEVIAAINADTDEGRTQLLAHLHTLEEMPRQDPAENFEAYVTLTLCRAVATALSPPQRAAPATSPPSPLPAA